MPPVGFEPTIAAVEMMMMMMIMIMMIIIIIIIIVAAILPLLFMVPLCLVPALVKE